MIDLVKLFDIATGKVEGDLGAELKALVEGFFGELFAYLEGVLGLAK